MTLDNFKSYSHLEVEFDKEKNYIFGDNSTGKTTILEAIYFLSLGRSFLKSSSTSLLKYETNLSKVSLIFNEDNQDHFLEALISKEGKEFYFDEEKLPSSLKLISKFMTFYFNPECVFLYKDEPSERRKLFDIKLSLIDPRYLYCLSRYKKLLKERNAALSKNYDKDVIDVLRNELINLSYRLVYERRKCVTEINTYLSKIYSSIYGEEKKAKIIYKTTSPLNDDQEEFINDSLKLFEDNKTVENISKTTVIGPHRDNYIFYLEEKDISLYSSQGENRIAALVTKIALLNYVKKMTNRTPVFLLDDILSDLDSKRQKNLLEYLNNDMQVIITGVSDIKLNNYTTYKLEQHNLRRI